MTIVGPDRDTGSMLTVTGLTGTGTIASNNVITATVTGGRYTYNSVVPGFPAQQITTTFTGAASGAFLGPGGAEVAMAYDVKGSDLRHLISGVLVAKR